LLSATWMEAEPQVLLTQPCHEKNCQNDYLQRSSKNIQNPNKNKRWSIIPSLSQFVQNFNAKGWIQVKHFFFIRKKKSNIWHKHISRLNGKIRHFLLKCNLRRLRYTKISEYGSQTGCTSSYYQLAYKEFHQSNTDISYLSNRVREHAYSPIGLICQHRPNEPAPEATIRKCESIGTHWQNYGTE
jgi:hypothetical protein